jgi:carotenoid 1,2-hydratase
VFSPYYALARRRGAADPLDHCALNVALYRPRGKRWGMTERRRDAIARDADHFAIGNSRLTWNGDALTIDIDEVAVPFPSRLRGRVRVVPSALNHTSFALDAAARHRWWPIAPCCRVAVDLDRPNWHWRGDGYFDINHGDAPLEADFAGWQWSRAATRTGTVLSYDTSAIDGTERSLGLRFDAAGNLTQSSSLPPTALPSTAWRIGRTARVDADQAPRILRTLEDAPFYARSQLAARVFGEDVAMMHESLSLARFRKPIVQAMLPFRMPRW